MATQTGLSLAGSLVGCIFGHALAAPATGWLGGGADTPRHLTQRTAARARSSHHGAGS